MSYLPEVSELEIGRVKWGLRAGGSLKEGDF